jgi:electron transport complex protein RnfG
MAKSNTNVLKQAWLVLVLAVCFGAALAGVHVGLSDRIEANRRAAALEAIPKVVPGAVSEGAEQTVLGGRAVYKVYDRAGAQRGWVIRAGGKGFQGPIELLVGLDRPAETITGLYVLVQTETPGLGDEITGPDFRRRFEGVPAGKGPKLVKTEPGAPDEVRAISGATVSSRSVCDIVNAAVADVRTALAGNGAEGASGDGE